MQALPRPRRARSSGKPRKAYVEKRTPSTPSPKNRSQDVLESPKHVPPAPQKLKRDVIINVSTNKNLAPEFDAAAPREALEKTSTAAKNSSAPIAEALKSPEVGEKIQKVRIGTWNDRTFTWIETIDPKMRLPTAGPGEGRVKDLRGKWGFIKDSSCPSYDLFFHITEVAIASKNKLKRGCRVQYTIQEDKWRNERKSKFKAVAIKLIASEQARPRDVKAKHANKSEPSSRAMQSLNWREGKAKAKPVKKAPAAAAARPTLAIEKENVGPSSVNIGPQKGRSFEVKTLSSRGCNTP